MKTYGVGGRKIGVYEPRDSRPPDAVTVVAHAAAFCFVDRIADCGGVLDAGAMTEAVARHCRLKIAPPGAFELRFDDLFAKAPPCRPRWFPSPLRT
jgi:hypothetical protein